MFLKQKFALGRSFESKYVSFKDNFPRGNYHCLYCSPLNFPPLASAKISELNYFQNFWVQSSWKPNVKFEKENRETPFDEITTVYLIFYNPAACLQDKFHGRVLSISSGYFPRARTWADRVSSAEEHYHVTWSISTKWWTIGADSVQWLSKWDYSICIIVLVEFY